MKFTKIMMVMMLVLTASVVFAACGSTGSTGNNGGTGGTGGTTDPANVFGSEVNKAKYEKATVDGILTSPTDEFFDKDVMVDAVITKICPAGCWFYIKDYTADNSATVELYVTKFQQRFLVPQGIEGTHVQVWGHVEADVKANILAAERMEIVK